MTDLIDTHIHFDDDRFDHDRDDVYARAIATGVTTMVIPATTQQRFSKVFSIAQQYENVYPTAGLHPVYIDHHTEEHLTLLESRLQTPECIAVGECGLDGFFKDLDYKKQYAFFVAQIELAARCSLPLIIHARNAVQNVTLAIKSVTGTTTGVIHSYNGSLQQAEQLIDLGYLISFGGAITYERATRLKKLIKSLPLDAIMVETDAPDQPVQSRAGSRNEPAYITEVIKTIAEIKDLPVDVIADTSNTNARRLFKLPG